MMQLQSIRNRAAMTCAALAALLVNVMVTGVTLAAQAPAGFQNVRPGNVVETLPATPLVFAAYAFVWAAVIVYVFLIWRKLGRVEQELADVHAQLRSGKRA